jgi:alkylation response protein AidB-like acyl-CoA dehydrogenase
LSLEQALAVLAERAAVSDAEAQWPAASWEALRASGVTGWMIPPEYGGAGRDRLGLLEGYGLLAGACLTTCFILSQRDAACRRLLAAGNEVLCRELLPPLARGERFITVGLAQLTTSRQHGRPALVARLEGERIFLDGVMPWVTGAARADHFLTGAVLDDGRQVVLVVPGDTPGVRVGDPQPLMALQGSLTAEVRCEGVALDRKWLVASPGGKGLAAGRGPGSLETSGLALGLATAAVAYLEVEAQKRPEWHDLAGDCRASLEGVREKVRALARGEADAEEASRVRARANALVLRVTQLALAVAKGAGFVRTHRAQLWARQALFFLVWSCPRPALEATVEYLRPPGADAPW